MSKQTAFPISSTQRASLDDRIKELVKRRDDQREKLIEEFESKYDLVFENCRRKN
jgi:predicted O-methyltransferase YrrM